MQLKVYITNDETSWYDRVRKAVHLHDISPQILNYSLIVGKHQRNKISGEYSSEILKSWKTKTENYHRFKETKT